MICDKCGFEHNNRSACPKCGARAIYVDEGYLKRRQEWEEAQKKGTAGKLPPGIMHSTLEDRTGGKDADRHEKGRSETASLSLHVKTAVKWVKDKAVKLFNLVKSKIVKRRGANNPVIRDLKFDDKPETLDESKLVLSHKVFKDNRKYYFMAGGGVVLIAVIAIILVNVISRIDRSQVLFFDGRFAYFAKEDDKALFGDMDGNIVLLDEKDGNVLAYGPKGIYFYRNGKTKFAEAKNSKIITYSEALNAVIYSEGDKLFWCVLGEKYPLNMAVNQVHDISCEISDNGKYWVVTLAKENEDATVYTLCYGNSKGEITEIYSGEKDVEIASLNDSGELVYLELEVGEYGIINNRDMKLYNGENVKTLATEVVEYSFYEEEQLVYIDSNERLYEITSDKNKEFLDDEVKAFIKNDASDKLYYQKDDGCYRIKDEMPAKVFEPSKSDYTLIWNEEADKIWYYDQSSFYEVKGKNETRYELMAEVSVVYMKDSNTVYFLEKNGELKYVDDKITTVENGVIDITKVDGVAEIAYLKENTVYIIKYKSQKNINIFMSSELNSVIYSQNRYYLTDLNSILWSIAENGEEKNSLGNVENYILVD